MGLKGNKVGTLLHSDGKRNSISAGAPPDDAPETLHTEGKYSDTVTMKQWR